MIIQYSLNNDLSSVKKCLDEGHDYFTPIYIAIKYDNYGLLDLVSDYVDILRVKKIKTINDEEECCICLDSFNDKKVVVGCPVCNNKFHKNCIRTWTLTSDNCPLCRTELILRTKKFNKIMRKLCKRYNY